MFWKARDTLVEQPLAIFIEHPREYTFEHGLH